MSQNIKVGSVTKSDGQYHVNVKPKNVPEGNIGGGGVVHHFDKRADAVNFRVAAKQLDKTPTNDEVNFVNKRTSAAVVGATGGGITGFAGMYPLVKKGIMKSSYVAAAITTGLAILGALIGRSSVSKPDTV